MSELTNDEIIDIACGGAGIFTPVREGVDISDVIEFARRVVAADRAKRGVCIPIDVANRLYETSVSACDERVLFDAINAAEAEDGNG